MIASGYGRRSTRPPTTTTTPVRTTRSRCSTGSSRPRGCGRTTACSRIGARHRQGHAPAGCRGLRITALDEPGPALAARARANLAGYPAVEVVEARFEDQAGGLSDYDLLAAATSWRWVEPAVGYQLAARAVRPGGHLASWGATHVFPPDGDPFFREIQEVYDAIDEGLPPDTPWPAPGELPEHTVDIEASGLFGVVAVEHVDWTQWSLWSATTSLTTVAVRTWHHFCPGTGRACSCPSSSARCGRKKSCCSCEPSFAAASTPSRTRCASTRPLPRLSTSATSSGPEWLKSVRTTGSSADPFAVPGRPRCPVQTFRRSRSAPAVLAAVFLQVSALIGSRWPPSAWLDSGRPGWCSQPLPLPQVRPLSTPRPSLSLARLRGHRNFSAMHLASKAATDRYL